MRIEKSRSAVVASSMSTRSSVRVSGFMVVSQSCWASISPRPLNRCGSSFLFALPSALRKSSHSFSEKK